MPQVRSRLDDLLLADHTDIERQTLDGGSLRLLRLRAFVGFPLALAASPDGRRLAFGEESMASFTRDLALQGRAKGKGTISVLDLRDNRIRRIPGPQTVWELAWSPDGKSLAVAGTDYTFALDSRQQDGAESQHSVAIISGL